MMIRCACTCYVWLCRSCLLVPVVTAYVAFATVPLKLAPAVALAVATFVTSPLTFAPATLFAMYLQSYTSPVTFEPGRAVKFAPSPDTYVKTPLVA